MSANDGRIVSAVQVFPDSGIGPNFGPNLPQLAPRDLAEVVFLSEGFQAGEMGRFERKVRTFVNWIGTLPWFDVLSQGIGFSLVLVESNESGQDDLRNGANVLRATYFDSAMGQWWQTDPDIMSYDSGLVTSVASRFVSNWRAAVLLVNHDEGRANAAPWAGTAVINVGTNDIDPANFVAERWMHVVLHELGHALFGLADEYDHHVGCGEETDHNHPWPGLEPGEPNLTRQIHLDELKWQHHVPEGISVPTATNPRCEDCTEYTNPFANDTEISNDSIGLFEGAGYYHCDLYRPAFQCRMNRTFPDFCHVCLESIHRELVAQLPSGANITFEPKQIQVIQSCRGFDDAHIQRFRIANFGDQSATVRLVPDDSRVQVTPVNAFIINPGRFVQCTATMAQQNTTFAVTPVEIEIVDDGTGTRLASIPGEIETCDPGISRGLRGVGTRNPTTRRFELDLGRVVRGHTTAHRITIFNRRRCCSATFSTTVSVLSGPLILDPSSVNPIELPPPDRNGIGGGEASFWFQVVTAPGSGLGAVTGQIQIDFTTLSGVSTTETIDVSIEVVDPPPFDVVLAVDRSGSMGQQTVSNGPRRIEAVFDAIDLFVGMLRDNDNIALVRFNQVSTPQNDLLLDLTPANSGAPVNQDGRSAVRALLTETNATFAPSGSTSLGAGGVHAHTVLDGGTTDRQFFVMLTDGNNNQLPVLSLPVARAVDTGRGAYLISIEMDELSDDLRVISRMDPRVDADGNEIGPAAQILLTGTLADEREFMLQKFYTQIIADESGEAFVLDPVHTLDTRSNHIFDISFGEVDYAATIAVVAHPKGVYPKYLELSLESPSGEVFEHAAVMSVPVGEATGRESFSGAWKLYDLNLVDNKSHTGVWRLTVRNMSDTAVMRYTLLIKARSDLQLAGQVLQADHRPGLPMKIVLKPTLFGRPVKLDEPVRVRIDRPDNSTDVLTLEIDENGFYSGRLYDTHALGIYHIAAEIGVTTPQGIRLTRSRYMTGFIFQPRVRKGEYPPRRKPHPLRGWKPISVEDWLRLQRT